MPSKKAAEANVAQRIIKKYPNRRLYDTDTSSYITLAQVKRLVMDSEPFVVLDVKTGEDLTRNILLQIILEEESNDSPMFTRHQLRMLFGDRGGLYGNNVCQKAHPPQPCVPPMKTRQAYSYR